MANDGLSFSWLCMAYLRASILTLVLSNALVNLSSKAANLSLSLFSMAFIDLESVPVWTDYLLCFRFEVAFNSWDCENWLLFNTACDLEIDPLLDIDWGLLVFWFLLTAVTWAIIPLTSASSCFLNAARVSFPTFASRDFFRVGLITVVMTGGD